MPRINLLPVKAARRRDTAKNELYVVLALLVAVLIGLYGWYGMTGADISEMEQRLAQLFQHIGSVGKQTVTEKNQKDRSRDRTRQAHSAQLK